MNTSTTHKQKNKEKGLDDMSTIFTEKTGEGFAIYMGSLLVTHIATKLEQEAFLETLDKAIKNEWENCQRRAYTKAIRRMKKKLEAQ